MAQRFLISDGDVVKTVTGWRIAVGGVVKDVLKATVADAGIARQYYPAATSPSGGDPRITWSTATILVRQQSQTISSASIWFDRSIGVFIYNNYPNQNAQGTYIQPALTAGDTGQYLIRVTSISGSVVTGSPTGVWLDLSADAQYLWELVQSVVGTLVASYTISIAADDGGGNPVANSQVDRIVNFNSEVTGASDIGWSDIQRDLVDIKLGEDGNCILTFNQDGTAVGSAHTSGAFVENWLSGTGEDMTVRVDMVSGTPPSGSALAFDLPLDQVRKWTLNATQVSNTVGENFVNEMDVTVTDNLLSTTKRITMHSWRQIPNTETIFTSEPTWLLSETTNTVSNQAFIEVFTDGTLTGKVTSDFPYDEVWHSEAPAASDPEKYEVMLVNQTGKSIGIIGPATDVWLSLATSQAWTFTWDDPTYQLWELLLRIRRIGQVSVNKEVKVLLGNLNDAGDPDFPPNDPEILP